MIKNLIMPPPDALHGVMARYSADPRLDKIDLGVGVYYNRQGLSPVMAAIKQAEQIELDQQTSKSYLDLSGVSAFVSEMKSFCLGDDYDRHIASVQTVGGTGAVRLAIELAAKANPALKVHVGTPTWPNHFTICEMLNIEAVPFSYFDKTTQTLQFENLLEAIRGAAKGDVVVFHGPCHNPSGQDLSDEQLSTAIDLAAERGVVPLIDAAYYGLGNDLDDDLDRLRNLLKPLRNAFLVMSCSKAFGLYRDRTGILFVYCDNEEEQVKAQATLERTARGNYSMPPAPGASSVARVLSTPELKALWRSELDQMRARVSETRQELFDTSNGHPVFSAITSQKGIFSLLPIDQTTVSKLAEEYAIYMPDSGRINIAGLKTGDAEKLCHAVLAVT